MENKLLTRLLAMITRAEFVQKLDQLAEIVYHLLVEEDRFEELYPKEAKLYPILVNEIQLFLINFPGEVIHAPKRNPQIYEAILKILWNNSDEHDFDIFDYVMYYSGIGECMISEYISRLKKLRPIFISIPEEYIKFQEYLREAIDCYVHGLKNASLILCVSVIEEALKSKLETVDLKYVSKIDDVRNPTAVTPLDLKDLINCSLEEGLINKEIATKLHKVRTKRNDAVHSLQQIHESELLQVIHDTVHLLEFLFNGKRIN